MSNLHGEEIVSTNGGEFSSAEYGAWTANRLTLVSGGGSGHDDAPPCTASAWTWTDTQQFTAATVQFIPPTFYTFGIPHAGHECSREPLLQQCQN